MEIPQTDKPGETEPPPVDLPAEIEQVMLPGKSLKTNLVKPVFEDVGRGQGTSLSSSASLQPVLDKLDSMAHELDSVLQVQRTVESIIKQAHPGIEPIMQPNAEVRSEVSKSYTEHVGANSSDLGFWRKDWVIPEVASNFTCTSRRTAARFLWEDLGDSAGLRAIHPDSWPKACMDAFSIIVLLYDSLVIPYQLAFPGHFDGWPTVVSWITLGFWLVDLVLGFFLGYRETDTVVTDLRRISIRYLKRGFLPSLAVWMADLLATLQQLSGDRGTSGTVIKVMRFIKLHRLTKISSLFRTGKVADARDWLVTEMREYGVNEHFEIMLRISNLVFYILWANHVGGCLWLIVVGAPVPRWQQETGIEEDPGGIFGYMLGFYATATAMIAGGSVVVPNTVAELLLQVIYVILGFILSSVLMSSLLAAVMEYQDAHRERNTHLKSLRQFLFQHRIDTKLAVPLVNQVYDRLGKRKQLVEGDVDALGLVAPSLRSELWSRVYGPSLKMNPVLCAFTTQQPKMVKDICSEALEHKAFKPGAPVFTALTAATGPIHVCHGDLEYTPAYSAADKDKSGGLQSRTTTGLRHQGQIDDKSIARKGDWICEAAFWIHWQHRGWLDAGTPCELMTVNEERFGLILSKHRGHVAIVQSYSDVLLRTLSSLGPFVSDLDRLPHQTIVSGMPLESRTSLSQIALDSLTVRVWPDSLSVKANRINQRQLTKLTEEVEAGTCDLVMKGEGVQRAVTIVALRLRRDDGTFLAQIGKIVDGAATGACELPGTKVRSGELPKEAIQHLFAERLPQLSERVEIGQYNVDTKVRVSSRYGLNSFYMRMVFDATLLEEPDNYTTPLVIKADTLETAPSRSEFTEATSWFSRRGMKRGSQMGLVKELQAFTLENPFQSKRASGIIYAWLGLEEFEFFSSPTGERHLQQFVGSLDVQGEDEDELKGASQMVNGDMIDTIEPEEIEV